MESTPRPEGVLPVLESVAASFRPSLADAIDYATELQPDREAVDPWFWAHSARFMLRNKLHAAAKTADSWKLRKQVPNCGVHLLVDGFHTVRVLRSVDGTTPHAGRNPTRQKAWLNQLNLASGGTLPPLSLVLDWHLQDDEPVIHVALPYADWNFRGNPRVHWRVALPGESEDFSALSFPEVQDDDDFGFLELANDEADPDAGAGAG